MPDKSHRQVCNEVVISRLFSSGLIPVLGDRQKTSNSNRGGKMNEEFSYVWPLSTRKQPSSSYKIRGDSNVRFKQLLAEQAGELVIIKRDAQRRPTSFRGRAPGSDNRDGIVDNRLVELRHQRVLVRPDVGARGDAIDDHFGGGRFQLGQGLGDEGIQRHGTWVAALVDQVGRVNQR